MMHTALQAQMNLSASLVAVDPESPPRGADRGRSCAASRPLPVDLAAPLPFLAGETDELAPRPGARAARVARGVAVAAIPFVFANVWVGASLRSSCASLLVNKPSALDVARTSSEAVFRGVNGWETPPYDRSSVVPAPLAWCGEGSENPHRYAERFCDGQCLAASNEGLAAIAVVSAALAILAWQSATRIEARDAQSLRTTTTRGAALVAVILLSELCYMNRCSESLRGLGNHLLSHPVTAHLFGNHPLLQPAVAAGVVTVWGLFFGSVRALAGGIKAEEGRCEQHEHDNNRTPAAARRRGVSTAGQVLLA